jgi:hypothetical protein
LRNISPNFRSKSLNTPALPSPRLPLPSTSATLHFRYPPLSSLFHSHSRAGRAGLPTVHRCPVIRLATGHGPGRPRSSIGTPITLAVKHGGQTWDLPLIVMVLGTHAKRLMSSGRETKYCRDWESGAARFRACHSMELDNVTWTCLQRPRRVPWGISKYVLKDMSQLRERNIF